MQTQEITKIITNEINGKFVKSECSDTGRQEEIWKTIDGFERFQCSNLGNFRYLKKGVYISGKQRLSHAGYYLVNLKNENGQKTFSSHRLIAQTFLSNLDNFPVVNHKDGNKINNNINNLEWCSREYNNQHAFQMRLKNSYKGENNFGHKLLFEQVKKIRTEYSSGKTTILKLSQKYKMSYSSISRIIRNITWKDDGLGENYFKELNKITKDRNKTTIKTINDKLTQYQAETIREFHFYYEFNVHKLAKIFNVSVVIICKIINNLLLPTEKFIVNEMDIKSISERNKDKIGKRILQKDFDIIKNLSLSGKKSREIAKIFNVGSGRVTQILRTFKYN